MTHKLLKRNLLIFFCDVEDLLLENRWIKFIKIGGMGKQHYVKMYLNFIKQIKSAGPAIILYACNQPIFYNLFHGI